MHRLLPTAVALTLLAAGCAHDRRSTRTGDDVRLTGSREPFTFSSWDVDRIEWPAPGAAGRAANGATAADLTAGSHLQPPDLSAVMPDGTALPLRGLTPAMVRPHADPATQPAATANGHVTAGGFAFDFDGDRLVHFVAAPFKAGDSTVQPTFLNHAADDRDVEGDVRRYPLPLDHDTCVRLFGGADGLQTDLSVPALLP